MATTRQRWGMRLFLALTGSDALSSVGATTVSRFLGGDGLPLPLIAVLMDESDCSAGDPLGSKTGCEEASVAGGCSVVLTRVPSELLASGFSPAALLHVRMRVSCNELCGNHNALLPSVGLLQGDVKQDNV